jgi:hypothetical protein
MRTWITPLLTCISPKSSLFQLNRAKPSHFARVTAPRHVDDGEVARDFIVYVRLTPGLTGGVD